MTVRVPLPALAARVLDAPPRLGAVRLVAVDGGAGAGKTTLAGRLADHLPGCLVLHVDDLLDGWGDLEGWWARAERDVLAPLAAGGQGRWRRYDWQAGAPAEEHLTGRPAVVLLEGVSTARRAARPLLSLSVWVDAPRDLRRRRGLDRDGQALAPRWDAWLAAEQAHHRRERTRERADVVVDGAAPAGPGEVVVLRP